MAAYLQCLKTLTDGEIEFTMKFARRSPASHLCTIRVPEPKGTAPRRTAVLTTRLAALRVLALLSLLVALWACGGGSLNVVTTHRPASDLRLELRITDQFQNTPTVDMHVQIFEGTNPQPVYLATSARLTCNGSDIKPSVEHTSRPCPRQVPGGMYEVAYTDEHGAVTTMMVPVPIGEFAILSPQPNAQVPIPTNGALQVRFSIPSRPSLGTISIPSVTASCGIPGALCGAVAGTFWNLAVVTPSVAPLRTPTPSVAMSCDVSSDLASVPPGPYLTFSGKEGVVTLTGDFAAFQPGPGRIDLSVAACAMPSNSGFMPAPVTFSDILFAPVVWSR